MFLCNCLSERAIPERQAGTNGSPPEDLLNCGGGGRDWLNRGEVRRTSRNQPLASGPARVIVILTMTRRSRRIASR